MIDLSFVKKRWLTLSLDVYRASEILLEHVLDDIDVRRRTCPRVLVQSHRAALRAAVGEGTRRQPEHAYSDQNEGREPDEHMSCPYLVHPSSLGLGCVVMATAPSEHFSRSG